RQGSSRAVGLPLPAGHPGLRRLSERSLPVSPWRAAVKITHRSLGVLLGVVAATGPLPLPTARAADLPRARGAYVATGSLTSPLANQAAAADERFVYAVDDAVIAKYDRASGKELARSTGAAKHLNSGFLWRGK